METATRGKTYKIGQAAKLLDVKPFVLRFWETEFKHVLVPVRTPAGQRAYTEANVATVREIKRLLYDEGLTIEGAKKRLGQPQGRARPAPSADRAPATGLAEGTGIAAGTGPGIDHGRATPAPAPAPAASPIPQAALPVTPPAPPDAQAVLLRATLRDVRAELTAIRDLLAARHG